MPSRATSFLVGALPFLADLLGLVMVSVCAVTFAIDAAIVMEMLR